MFRVPTARVLAASRTLPIAIITALLAVAFLGAIAPAASAAPAAPYFGSNVQVDRPPAYTAYNPSLAVGTDGVVYLAITGWGGATTQSDVFFTKSTDGGRTWTLPIRVNNDAGGASQWDPSLSLDDRNDIYIVWTDSRNGNNDIFFAKSTDGGLSFSANVRVNDVTTSFQQEADVAVDPVNRDLVHVVWADNRNLFTTGPDIYYANSTDGGLSFNPSSRVNNDATGTEQSSPAIGVAPNRDVYVAWSDPRTGARGRDIYFSKSTDRGATWTPNIPLNDDSGSATQSEPAIAVDEGGSIYVAWTDYRNGNTQPDIYATRSTNAGSSFAANVQVNDDTAPVPQIMPSLAARAGKIQLAWADYRTGGSNSYDIYTASSTDGLTWSENMRVNDDTQNLVQYTPSIGLDAQGDVYAAWFDQRGATGQDVFAATRDVVAPTADAGSAITVDQGVAASFDGSGSSDNLGIAAYAWDFGDGASGAGSADSHAYSAPGTYTAALTVWDYSGNSATASVTITVRDTENPVAHGDGDRSTIEGGPLFFDASASTDNVGVLSYSWNFGDGSTATGATASHVYSTAGAYTATLTVTDGAGNSATATFKVTVRPDPLSGMLQLLEAIIAILAIALALLGWMVFGMRKRARQPPMPPMSTPPQAQPPAQPPKEQDPLDMQLPPAPPKSP